jgi:hypothetical protein
MTASSPMSVQGQPAVIVPATTQTPKAIIPAEIRNESTGIHDWPPFFRAQTIDGVESFDPRLGANERNEPELRGVQRTQGFI